MTYQAKNVIKVARKKSGLKVKELAMMLEIAPNTLLSWENNNNPRNPGFKHAIKLVGILGKQGLTMQKLGFAI